MKLRLESGSIRLRLKKPDMKRLCETGRVEETVQFPGQPLCYCLSVSGEGKEVLVEFRTGIIEVFIPQAIAANWCANEEVGIYHTLLAAGKNLDILIEKDFPCRNQPAEEQEGTFFELAEKQQLLDC